MKKLLFAIAAVMMLALPCCAQKKATPAAKLPAGVVVMKNPTATSGPEILKAIAADNKGKVAVIDFWATWCGPCMNAMKQIDPIKEKYLKDKKKINFVYVTGETSPKDKFDTAIPNIKGSHYRLSNEQFNSLLKHLGIKGIPSYMILNADGTTSYDNIASGGYPGDDVITEEIEKALVKK